MTPLAEAGQLPSVKELPDPFLMNDGTRVKRPSDWQRRRAQLQAAILYYQFGSMPGPPANLTDKEIVSGPSGHPGATEKQVLLTMGPQGKIALHLEMTLPAGDGPFPVIACGDMCWGRVGPTIVREVIQRGYILVNFDRTEVVPDRDDRAAGAYPLYGDHDWGALAAWAWGYHRVVDYLVRLDCVDAKRIAITGHSRGGKAVLLAGALDERISLTAPNNSGCGGAGCYRHQAPHSEDIAAITGKFPFWWGPRMKDFVGRVDRLPFDQHSLKALVAPRALLTTEALGDLWANPEGTQVTHTAARQVFEFLRAADRIGICFRQGQHEHGADDWAVLLDFADLHLRGKPTGRKFDQLAFPNAPKCFSWSAPAPAR